MRPSLIWMPGHHTVVALHGAIGSRTVAGGRHQMGVTDVELDEFVQQFRLAVDEFAKGNPEPTKALFSHTDEVTLANPFGPISKGWDEVSDALSYASSRFRDGKVTTIDHIAEYASGELACLLDREHWQARVGESQDKATFTLRVTTTLRHEDGRWKIVHRHADPIATFDPSGPMRASTG